MDATNTIRGRIVRWGVLGAAGACALGLVVPAVGAAAPAAAAAPPAGAVVVGTASGTCPRPAFAAIQPAVDATPAGGTIYVCAGTYTGTVTIPKTLKLLGAQYGRDARTGRTTPATESVVTSTGAGFVVNGPVDGLVVDGFTFAGSGGDGLDAINRGSGFSIVNNVFADNQNGMNVNAAGPASSTIARNRFTTNNRNAASGQGGQGVLFTSGPANAVSVVENAFAGHENAAVNSIGDPSNRSKGIVVRGNRSTDDSSFAVVNNADGAVVEGNQATKGAAAVDGTIIYIVGNTDRLAVRGNQLSGDVGTGISANGAFGSAVSTNLLIEGNVVRGRTTGILVNGDHRSVTIKGNTVQNSTRTATLPGRGIRLTAGSGGLVVTGNAVSGSSDVDCVDESVGTRTAGTADTWSGNAGRTASPAGLCSPGRAPAPVTTTRSATR